MVHKVRCFRIGRELGKQPAPTMSGSVALGMGAWEPTFLRSPPGGSEAGAKRVTLGEILKVGTPNAHIWAFDVTVFKVMLAQLHHLCIKTRQNASMNSHKNQGLWSQRISPTYQLRDLGQVTQPF